MKRIIWLLVLIFLISCEKEKMDLNSLGENAGIAGTWVEEVSLDFPFGDTTVLNRKDSLYPDGYGFIIREDGSFEERKNAGWCGTPPIFYDNFEGTWEALSDSLLSVTVGYWGGSMSFQIRIISLDDDQLKIRYLYAENLTDSR